MGFYHHGVLGLLKTADNHIESPGAVTHSTRRRPGVLIESAAWPESVQASACLYLMSSVLKFLVKKTSFNFSQNEK